MKRSILSILFYSLLSPIFGQTNYIPIENNPLPKDTLRMLCIGNSFTEDAVEYIDEITDTSGINKNTFCVYILTKGGTHLGNWATTYEQNDTVTIYKKAGSIIMPITTGTMSEIFQQNWDVISLQQLSTKSGDIRTFSPYLENLITAIQKDCTNKAVALCWHLTWSAWEEYNENTPKGINGWSRIVSTTDNMIQKYGIDIIIPSGTAIQNARASQLNTPKALTRDGRHLDLGIGRYIAASTLYEAIFYPIFKISISTNTFIPQNVTENDILIAKQIVQQAIDNWHYLQCDSTITSDSIQIFPNPVKDVLSVLVQAPNENTAQISIFDSLGKLKLKDEIQTNMYQSINLSKFAHGKYTIIVYVGNKKHTQSIEKL